MSNPNQETTDTAGTDKEVGNQAQPSQNDKTSSKRKRPKSVRVDIPNKEFGALVKELESAFPDFAHVGSVVIKKRAYELLSAGIQKVVVDGWNSTSLKGDKDASGRKDGPSIDPEY